MSKNFEGRDPLDIAKEAERDLASSENNPSGNALRKDVDRAQDSGVNENLTDKFPGSTVTTGSAASGAGDNREIPVEEGGDVDAKGRVTKAKHFEGEGGPQEKEDKAIRERGGDQDVGGNIKQ